VQRLRYCGIIYGGGPCRCLTVWSFMRALEGRGVRVPRCVKRPQFHPPFGFEWRRPVITWCWVPASPPSLIPKRGRNWARCSNSADAPFLPRPCSPSQRLLFDPFNPPLKNVTNLIAFLIPSARVQSHPAAVCIAAQTIYHVLMRGELAWRSSVIPDGSVVGTAESKNA
jgi:hypothetical protein